MAKSDYLPTNDAETWAWAENLGFKINAHAVPFGLTPAQVGEIENVCQAVWLSITDNNAAQTTAKQAMENKKAGVTTFSEFIRPLVKSFKTNANYTEAIGADLGLIGTETTFDPETYKPELSAMVFPGRVTLKFTKKGADGVNIYARLKGQTAWIKVSFDSHLPYEDNRPLIGGAAEMREYMCIGVVKDLEVGQASDIVEAAFAG